MKKRPIIAIAQIKYFDISSKNNVEKIKKFIRQAKRRKADIICFPESCVHKTEVLFYNDDLIKEIREECKKNSIWCIITEDLNIKRRKYNVSILIDREGKIKGRYKKIHLYGDDTSSGRKIGVFDTDFAKIGIVICWDLAFPELFKKMKDAGAEIVFCPAQWCYEKKAYKHKHKKEETRLLESLIRARAFENLYFVALCNPIQGERKDQISYSAICSPHKILKELIDDEGIITAEVNLDEIGKLRKLYENV
jgi:omega-amidase